METYYSTLAEKDFFEILAHAVSGSSMEHKRLRVEGLEELQRRIKSSSIQDKNEAIRILLDMAKKQGNNQPESSLTIESLSLFISKDAEYFQAILNRLEGQPPGEENLLFLVFSKLVRQLDYNKKREGIKPLIGFLMTRDALNDLGVTEVYDCLVHLGNEKLGAEIVKAVLPFLDYSLKICTIIFSVRLCAKFADNRLLPKMLTVLDKSMKGYFDGHYDEIERDICQFLERIGDAQSLDILMKLLKTRHNQDYNHVSKAIASVLDANPYRVDDILDMLYDERRDEKVIIAILRSLEKMEKSKIDVRKLLANIRIDWVKSYETSDPIYFLLLKGGKSSKPVLFEILRQDDERKYNFALGCLKRIGISNEEISAIFPKPPMLQIYEYFYKGRGNIPKDLSQVWEEKEKIRGNVPGKTNWLEHLLLHVFQSFNFVTMNLAPLQIEGIDIVCFYPETLDLFIIGCTTGIIKNDLATMDALVKKMKIELTDLPDKCSITPIVVSSEIAAISPSDAQYAVQNKIVIMQRNHIDILLEMLNTNRQSREVIEYIKRIYPDSAISKW